MGNGGHMHSGARALKLEQCAPSFRLRDRFDAVQPSLSHRVSVSLWRKSCAGICVSQARFEFCMNCISSLKNENKAANYLKFDNLLDPTYLCFNRLSSVPEMTSPLLEWCQLFIYVKQFDIPSPLPKAKGQMHIMRALYDFYINTDTHTHTYSSDTATGGWLQFYFRYLSSTTSKSNYAKCQQLSCTDTQTHTHNG